MPQQGRTTGGLIGQVSTASASAAGFTPAIGYDDRRLGQQVAKLRLAGSSGGSANGAGPIAGQLALAGRDYGSQVLYPGGRAVGQIPSIGQYSSGATQDFMTYGRHAPAYGGGSFAGPRSNSVPSAIGGPPIGQVGGQGQHPVGQIQGSGVSVGPNPSPFVPASTSHPITGGSAGFYPHTMLGGSESAQSVSAALLQVTGSVILQWCTTLSSIWSPCVLLSAVLVNLAWLSCSSQFSESSSNGSERLGLHSLRTCDMVTLVVQRRAVQRRACSEANQTLPVVG